MDMKMMWLCILLTMVTITLCAEDYYSVLGIRKTAGDREIKKAYRKLVLQNHPDKNKEEGVAEKFREIVEAYKVLSDGDKRKEYDMMGHDRYLQVQSGGGGKQPFNHGFNFDFRDIFADFDRVPNFFGGFVRDFDDGFMDMEDFFGSNFGEERFGSHDSFFGGGHFQHADHMRRHQGAHQRAHYQHHFNQHGNVHQEHFNQRSRDSGGRTCRTITQRVGNMVTRYTTC